jgi:hypothetical protein
LFFSISVPVTTHRATVEVFEPASTEIINNILKLKLKLKLIYDRQSVGQSVLVSGAHLGPATNLSFSSSPLLSDERTGL